MQERNSHFHKQRNSHYHKLACSYSSSFSALMPFVQTAQRRGPTILCLCTLIESYNH